MRGAVVLERIDLDNCTTTVPLELQACRLDRGLTANSANLRKLALEEIDATGHGVEGAVHLLGAHVRGQLCMYGASLTNRSGPALHADQITVEGGIFLSRGFTANGQGERGAVRLPGAHIGGQLILSGATLTNESGPALRANGVSVGSDMILDEGFTADGQGELGAVRLSGARVGGQLSLSGASLTSESGPALAAGRVTVANGMFLDEGFTASGQGGRGTVRLPGTHIGGQLVLSGATLANESGPALFANGVSVGSDMFLNEGFTTDGHGELGAVWLTGARIGGGLVVSPTVLSQAESHGRSWVVDGLTYAGYPAVTVDAWTRFLQEGTTAYAAQPYQQLAGACRAAGHDAEARQVLIAQRDDQVKRGDLARIELLWTRFTRVALGYGYQPWRAAIGLLSVFGLALILVLTLGARADVLGPSVTTTTTTVADAPPQSQTVAMVGRCDWFGRVAVAADISIPLISTSQVTACGVQPGALGNLFAALAFILRAFAWAAAVLFAAAFTSIVRRT